MLTPRQWVSLLLPTSKKKLQVKWQGPYVVQHRVREVDYERDIPYKYVKLFHVNLLKAWKPPLPTPREEPAHYGVQPDWIEEGNPREQEVPGQEKEEESLSAWQRQQGKQVLANFSSVFSDRPGDVKGVLNHVWICIDFLRLNLVSAFDVYSLPQVDAPLNVIGDTQVLSTIDLTKGYWQIPLAPAMKKKTAFATHSGLYRFLKKMIGLHRAAASFQQVMAKVLKGA